MDIDGMFYRLIEKIKKSNPQADVSDIERAYRYAYAAHDGQKRLNGVPYITHPLEVADILVDMGLDKDSIIAGLLHDSVEDTDSTYDDICRNFGSTVAGLVDGVTRLGKIKYRSKAEEQMEDLRKMFMAMAKDIRVILIKLADRLHNMRTIKAMPLKKQKQKSLETMEIYAPIAHRLGMQYIKWQLEDLSLRCLDPVGYKEILDTLDQKAKEREAFIQRLKKDIHERVTEIGIKAQTEGRIKHVYSIYRKMYTQNKTIDEIYDICAVRVIVDNLTDCYNVLGIIHDMYKPIPGRFKDYIGTPKPNGYRSLHTTVIGHEGIPFEVQIRTFEMHQMAEYGVAAHWKYKRGIKSTENDQAFAWIRQLLEAQLDSEPEDFLKTIKVELFADEVFVFTPSGDVINMPNGATPIDFAYAIHSEVGHHMVGAKVGGRIVTFDYQLKSGEIVDIITSKDSKGPSMDWLKIVKTNTARTRIKQWFKKENRDADIIKGREELERDLKESALYDFFQNEDVTKMIVKRFSHNSIDELYASIGYGVITTKQIINRLREEILKSGREEEKANYLKSIEDKRNQAAKQNLIRHQAKANNDIIVEGLDGCLVRFAHCCTPIPGDKIIGFVTKGYGVSVHRADCENATESKSEHDDSRWVKVWWSENAYKKHYVTKITIYAVTRVGLVADITMLLSTNKINVQQMSAKDIADEKSLIVLSIQIDNKKQLEKIIAKIKQIRGVSDVER